MSKALAIGSHVKLAFDGVNSARKLGPKDRQAAMILFYAVENLVMATLASEDIPRSVWRASAGNHQLDRMIDALPPECSTTGSLENFSLLTQYSTGYRYPSPTGGIQESPEEDLMQNWLEQGTDIVQVYARHFQVNIRNEFAIAESTSPFRSKDHDKVEPR